MCLALPARIEEKKDDDAWVRIGDARMKINLVMTPQANIGDYVLIHAGFAIQQVDEREAKETWDLFEQISEAEQATAEVSGSRSAGESHDGE